MATYLKEFETELDYADYMSNKPLLPNVTHIVEDDTVRYSKGSNELSSFITISGNTAHIWYEETTNEGNLYRDIIITGYGNEGSELDVLFIFSPNLPHNVSLSWGNTASLPVELHPEYFTLSSNQPSIENDGVITLSYNGPTLPDHHTNYCTILKITDNVTGDYVEYYITAHGYPMA